MRVVHRAAVAVLVVLAGCHGPSGVQPAGAPSKSLEVVPANFVDRTKQAGVDFVHCMGDKDILNIIESQGGGAAWLDYDQDGFMDLYLVTGIQLPELQQGPPLGTHPRNRLFHNNGDGTFTDVTDKAGVGLSRYCMGVTVGDFDNDGYPDIYVCCYHGPNVLYHNNRDGTFTDVTKRAGVGDYHDSVSAVFFDYDNDGYLDLYVGNYLHYDPKRTEKNLKPGEYPGPLAYDGEPGVLYHNNRDGTFTDVTKKMGVYNPTGKAMGVCAADYDGDGYVDLYQANDGLPKWLYHNEHCKRFKEVGGPAGVATGSSGVKASSMMGTWADYDGDGKLDLFVSDDLSNPLFHNEGNGVFRDMAQASGITSLSGKHTSWGACFLDYANDGRQSLFIANGGFFRLEGEKSFLFSNDGKGHFSDISAESGPFFGRKLCSRAAAMADYDNDGRVDLVVTTLHGPAVLLHNETLNAGNWVLLKLVGSKSNRDGVGATVRVTCGGHTWMQQKQAGGAYLSANDPRLHFGLGRAKVIDRLEVSWPSGTSQALTNVPVNQYLLIEEPAPTQSRKTGKAK